MTDKTQALLPVTQEDREAAADFAETCTKYSFVWTEAPAIRRGQHDEWEIVQALARHRISHSLPGDVGTVSAVDAFEMGFSFGMSMRGQTLEDSRAVGRLLTSDTFKAIAPQIEKATKELGFDSFQDADSGMCQAKRIIRAALTPSALSPEHCQRCGHNNPSWSAPSPLWNAVIRGGSIDGEPKFDDMVCAACFMELAEQQGIASGWTVKARNVVVPLETTTPSGRVWDEDKGLWVSAVSGDAGDCETCGGAGEVFGHAEDCSNDSCALNGDMDSCNGKVEACHSCSGDAGEVERLREQLQAVEGALILLEKAASEVHRKGAVAGAQWPKLAGALVRARAWTDTSPAALPSHQGAE